MYLKRRPGIRQTIKIGAREFQPDECAIVQSPLRGKVQAGDAVDYRRRDANDLGFVGLFADRRRRNICDAKKDGHRRDRPHASPKVHKPSPPRSALFDDTHKPGSASRSPAYPALTDNIPAGPGETS